MSGPLKGLSWTTSMNYEYLTGKYLDDEELKIIQNSLKENNSVFYDVGANVGYVSIAVTRLTNASVYAFEPIPEHQEKLKMHLDLNEIKHVKIFPMAVSDKTGQIEFSNSPGSEGNTYKKESAMFSNFQTFTVSCISIDDFISQHNPVPQLLKIDVEGAELDVLHGAINTIRNHRPDILIATHDCHIAGIKDKCIEFLISENYSLREVGAEGKELPGLADFYATPLN
jgi:FkbM family methyltransferase